MCGYAGILLSQSFPAYQNGRDAFERAFFASARAVSHRGNDDAREFKNEFLLLSHFRLAFQDVALGVQPWFSPDKKFAIVFNGEIYNHFDVRKRILAKTHYDFLTRSDTETLLAAYLTLGESFIESLEGEYSFVIVKTDGSELFACRDHFGVKPLFFGLEGVDTNQFAIASRRYEFKTSALHFASEMKGLSIAKRWNREGLLRQFVGLFEPIRTPFENIIALPRGGRLHALKTGHDFKVSLRTVATSIRAKDANAHARDFESGGYGNTLRQVLGDSVEERLLSDVELGVYLSGGIDSKAVGIELAERFSRSELSRRFAKPKAFTVGFEDAPFDESAEALRFARNFGFEPHAFKVSNEALNYSYPHAVYTSENVQPYTNGAAKWWLSLFTRQYVHGVLTGDGADEIWGGYPSFRYAAAWKFAMRQRAGVTLNEKLANAPLGSSWRDSVYANRFFEITKNPWLAGASAAGSGIDFVKSFALWGVPHPLFEQIETIAKAILGKEEGHAWLSRQTQSVRSWFLHGFECADEDAFLSHPENTILLWQNYFCHTHLPVQVLNWVGDRMEMANTLEGRTPFLSQRMWKFVYNLPDVALLGGLGDKSLLRRAFRPKMSADFAFTPKKQFGAPFLQAKTLMRDYSTKDALALTGLTQSVTLEQLQKQVEESTAFERAHLEQTLQTILCLSIVQRTLVEGKAPTRDEAFEARVKQQRSAH